ncbi:hypothetical protein ABGT15_06590 [Flavobacterium enshiense]|uniref:hypothetical protein n=1 Tax=Flavobacterium enshiense TaxID=1341165 RepID=UPI00345D9989
MKLYVLEALLGAYKHRTQSLEPSGNNTFSGTTYNEKEDFTGVINTLQYRLERDVYDKKKKKSFIRSN